MSLKKLQVNHLRNLTQVDLQLSPHINLFYGINGSGKTSILEAINILSLGRSFRSHKHKTLINYGQSAFTVFGRLIDKNQTDVSLGITRDNQGELTLRADGRNLQSVAEMANLLPVQVINSDSFLLLVGSPQVRRQFMDWLVFHVEHDFFPCWRRLQLCLKQRNSLLRCDRIDPLQLAVWDSELILLTEKIDEYRQAALALFLPTFNALVNEFVAIEGLSLNYRRGWDSKQSYSQVLEANRERDCRVGLTHAGSHRAELKLLIHGQDAADILSRGQQKLLVCAMKIAQGLVFHAHTASRCLYLVDDLPAELDSQSRELLAHWLQKMNTQVFVTGVEAESLLSTWQKHPDLEIKMFHVEHGCVNTVLSA
jgi:DNA replication and repair protein RecF